MAFAIVTIAFSTSAALTLAWPKICWLPRVGGIFAGVSIFVLGYMQVNRDRFNVPWRWGLTREQAYSHFANFSALFGTLMGVFGDLIHQVLWVPACACFMK